MPVTPDDLIEAAALSHDFVDAHLEHDWTLPAGNLDWSCRDVLVHLCRLSYAADLATESPTRRPWALMPPAGATTAALGATVQSQSKVLAEVARAMPASARGYHPGGATDPEGFLAMAIDELLIHTADVAAGFGVRFAPPSTLARAVLDRLFPWWPTSADPWDALRWANGRCALPDHPDQGATWLWHCRPLSEWDGTIPRWDPSTATPTRS